MKIKTFIEFSDEIEVNISTDDICAAFAEDFDPVSFLKVVNNIATFLNGIPEEFISDKLTEPEKKAIREYFHLQSERF